MKKLIMLIMPAFILTSCGSGGSKQQSDKTDTGMESKYQVQLMTVDPGHFHAALVQKTMYPQVSPEVNVYAPEGPDYIQHLDRIKSYNSRPVDPTSWNEIVYTGNDFFEKMLEDRPGNVVVLSGNNKKKAEYITKSVNAGLNVLADKPMIITPEAFPQLEEAFRVASEKGILVYDIMTERFEVTTLLQKLLSQKEEIFAAEGVGRGTAAFKAMRRYQKEALDCLQLSANCDQPMVQYVVLDSLANVLCPACKLWNTGHGANMMREAVSLMGGYGITEDCPGFLGHKWMDAQLEATYEGPEAVQRRQLSVTMTNELFLAQFHRWIAEMRDIAGERPGTGACTLASAMQLWLWTLNYLQKATDPDGSKLYHSSRQGVTFPLADALCWLLASRYFILDLLELSEKGPANPVVAEGLPGLLNFYTDLCHVQSTRAAGEVARICAELVYGYRPHPAWDTQDYKGCFKSDELIAIEAMVPGMSSVATDVVESDGSHPAKEGPCATFDGIEQFIRIRNRLDGCLTGSHLAKERAADALTKVMIPEALDYPA